MHKKLKFQFIVSSITLFTILFIPAPTRAASPAPDINQDGSIDLLDFQLLIQNFDTNHPPSDLNNNQLVDIFDFTIFIKYLLTQPTPTPSLPAPTSIPNLPIPTPSTNPSASQFYVSPTGNDANPGTAASPFHTIQHAINYAPSNSQITVLEGNYPETIKVAGDQLVLTGQNATVIGINITGNYNQVSHFEVDGQDVNQYGIRVSGDHNQVSHNDIHHTHQDGIWFFGQYNTFAHNTIHDIPQRASDPHIDCFQTWGPAQHIRFEANYCHNPNTYGSNQIVMVENQNPPVSHLSFINNVFVMDDSGYSPINIHRKTGQSTISEKDIHHNTFFHSNSGESAISLHNISNARIHNNLIINYGATRPYINTYQSSAITISHNAVSLPSPNMSGGLRTGDSYIPNPSVISLAEHNFRLKPDSPLVDSGREIPTITHDFDALPRPIGSGFDIGAFESY